MGERIYKRRLGVCYKSSWEESDRSKSRSSGLKRKQQASKQSMNSSIYSSGPLVWAFLAFTSNFIWALQTELGDSSNSASSWSFKRQPSFIERLHLAAAGGSGQTSAPVVAATTTTASSLSGDSGTPSSHQEDSTLAPNRHAHDILIDHLAQLEPGKLARVISSRLRELLRRLMECRPTRPTPLLNCSFTGVSSQLGAGSTSASSLVEPPALVADT